MGHLPDPTVPRLDALARRLATRDVEITSRSVATQVASADHAFESVARTLASPLTRRRALVVTGAAAVAASLLRPGRAAAAGQCPSGGPNVCSNSGGAKVCVPANLACCSNENCAIACPYPWRVCASPARCDDTAAMCRAGGDPSRVPGSTLFCSKEVTVVNGCVDGGESPAIRGWCCNPSTDVCGADLFECKCAKPCGSTCCKTDQDCINPPGLFSDKYCSDKCRPGWHRDGVDCKCDKGDTCGVRCCPPKTVCIDGTRCGTPPKKSDWPGLFDAFGNFGDTANQSAAGHQAQRRRAAVAGSPVAGALTALAAVNAQGVAAGLALNGDASDKAFKRKVRPASPSLPKLVPGAGLDASAASALDALIAAQAKAFALVFAVADALARARGAADAGSLKRMRKQTLDAAGFADQAGKALKALPPLRAAAAQKLRASGAVEVEVTVSEILATQTAVLTSGIPADLLALLKQLGLSAAGIELAREALLKGTEGGPTLIAPLEDGARVDNLGDMQKSFAGYAKSTRKEPVERTKGGPLQYTPSS